MRKYAHLPRILIRNAIVLAFVALICVAGNQAINTSVENVEFSGRKIVIIDAGHGGIDGGATSITGVLESQINLEIALRLEDLFHLLGIPTKMIRRTDRSVYTQGGTISAQKVSDLKNRVQTINQTENAILLSIHQNYFSASQYAGAQAFYSPTKGSEDLAHKLQTALIGSINAGSRRKAKKASGIYLMEHVRCPGVLLECGFLSNPEEEAKLRNKQYQNKLCCVVAVVCTDYLNHQMLS